MKRIITKNDKYGKSYILSDQITNVETPLPEFDNQFKFYNLWMTEETPVLFNNDDPVANKLVSTTPPANGSMFRIVNYPPEKQLLNKINKMTDQELINFEQEVGVKLDIKGKHPLMHMTKSIDFGIVLQGEIYLVLDNDEILLKPFDTIIQRATYHAWSNRSNQDCLMAYVLIDAVS